MTANPSVKERTIERMVFTFMVCQTQSNLKEPPPFFTINEKGNIKARDKKDQSADANLFLHPLQQKATVSPLEFFAVIDGLALRSGLTGHILFRDDDDDWETLLILAL